MEEAGEMHIGGGTGDRKARGLGLIWEQGEEHMLGWHVLEIIRELQTPQHAPRHSKHCQQEQLICALS